MNKTFVLDTNVVLHDPLAPRKFQDEEVVIPIYAIEEIDRFKRELSERGRNARAFSRYLDKLRAGGNLANGVDIETGGRLRVAFVKEAAKSLGDIPTETTADNLILAVALEEQQRRPEWPVIFVTRDVNLRIRADAMGLQAVDFVDEHVEISELYSGTAELTVPADTIDKLYAGTPVELPSTEKTEHLYPNQFLVLKDEGNPGHTGIARYDADNKRIAAVRRVKESAWGIRPRNKEQHFSLDLLLNDDIKLVTLVGKAGTGKTLLAIAAGLQKVVEEHKYKKLQVSRPVFPLGRDIGFLPGDLEEKLNPWMQPIFDNLELLMGLHSTDRETRSYREFIDLGFVAIEPLTYIRGRSIANQFMIVDEAQNLTPHEIKTIITRVGDNTKIILTGDPYQIDNPYVDSTNNGLSTVVEKFKGESVAGHLTLFKGERSALAELAANLL